MITKRNDLLSKKVIQGLKNRHMNGYYVHSKQEALDLAFEIADFFGKRIDEIFIHERGNKNEKE